MPKLNYHTTGMSIPKCNIS